MPTRSSRRPSSSRSVRVAGLVLALAGLSLAATTAAAGQASAAGQTTAVTAVAPAFAVTSAVSSLTRAPDGQVRHASCSTHGKHTARCLSYWQHLTQPKRPSTRSTATGAAKVAPPTAGITPANIQAVYQLPKKGAKNQTIAVVDAYNDPNLAGDLNAYRAAFKLPACTTANKCFRKVDQRGGTKYPVGDPGWAVETSLDVEAVSASCPTCKILVVEADDEDFASLGAAVNTAVKLGADVVSNSYGGDEFNGITALGKKYYTHPGVPILASSGDSGFTAASFPAVLKTTWAIGGTELSHSKSGWHEAAWDGSGSGCSAWITKPAAQTDTNCDMRTVADVSAMADSEDGFAVYDTYGLGEDDGWIGVGGTSLSSPLIAGVIGLAGNSAKVTTAAYAYAHRSGLKDVVGGSNGFCGNDYLCTGLKGYDAPTGLGSPRGLKSF